MSDAITDNWGYFCCFCILQLQPDLSILYIAVTRGALLEFVYTGFDLQVSWGLTIKETCLHSQVFDFQSGYILALSEDVVVLIRGMWLSLGLRVLWLTTCSMSLQK